MTALEYCLSITRAHMNHSVVYPHVNDSSVVYPLPGLTLTTVSTIHFPGSHEAVYHYPRVSASSVKNVNIYFL